MGGSEADVMCDADASCNKCVIHVRQVRRVVRCGKIPLTC
jgi:hypothetical protein